jgi:hypothetical protein
VVNVSFGEGCCSQQAEFALKIVPDYHGWQESVQRIATHSQNNGRLPRYVIVFIVGDRTDTEIVRDFTNVVQKRSGALIEHWNSRQRRFRSVN